MMKTWTCRDLTIGANTSTQRPGAFSILQRFHFLGRFGDSAPQLSDAEQHQLVRKVLGLSGQKHAFHRVTAAYLRIFHDLFGAEPTPSRCVGGQPCPVMVKVALRPGDARCLARDRGRSQPRLHRT
jgi:hypothetical protein